jgi:hypothetical protein
MSQVVAWETLIVAANSSCRSLRQPAPRHEGGRGNPRVRTGRALDELASSSPAPTANDPKTTDRRK